MNQQAMTNEENYRFDVAGYMIVPGALSAAELKACNQALDQLGPLEGPLRWTSPICNALHALREQVHVEEVLAEEVRVRGPPEAERGAAEGQRE